MQRNFHSRMRERSYRNYIYRKVALATVLTALLVLALFLFERDPILSWFVNIYKWYAVVIVTLIHALRYVLASEE